MKETSDNSSTVYYDSFTMLRVSAGSIVGWFGSKHKWVRRACRLTSCTAVRVKACRLCAVRCGCRLDICGAERVRAENSYPRSSLVQKISEFGGDIWKGLAVATLSAIPYSLTLPRRTLHVFLLARTEFWRYVGKPNWHYQAATICSQGLIYLTNRRLGKTNLSRSKKRTQQWWSCDPPVPVTCHSYTDVLRGGKWTSGGRTFAWIRMLETWASLATGVVGIPESSRI